MSSRVLILLLGSVFRLGNDGSAAEEESTNWTYSRDLHHQRNLGMKTDHRQIMWRTSIAISIRLPTESCTQPLNPKSAPSHYDFQYMPPSPSPLRPNPLPNLSIPSHPIPPQNPPPSPRTQRQTSIDRPPHPPLMDPHHIINHLLIQLREQLR